MNRLEKETLTRLCDELAAHPWTETELTELVAPRLGIITDFQDLLDQLETLRQVDLGDLPPAQGVPSGVRDKRG